MLKQVEFKLLILSLSPSLTHSIIQLVVVESCSLRYYSSIKADRRLATRMTRAHCVQITSNSWNQLTKGDFFYSSKKSSGVVSSNLMVEIDTEKNITNGFHEYFSFKPEPDL